MRATTSSPFGRRRCCGAVSAAHAGLITGKDAGIRGGYYNDAESSYIGVGLNLHFLRFNLNPNYEYVFVDNGQLMSFNLDAFFNFTQIPGLPLWAGAGFGLLYANPDGFESSTDPALNIIAGAGFNIVLNPFVQVKYIAVDKNDGFVFTVGLRF